MGNTGLNHIWGFFPRLMPDSEVVPVKLDLFLNDEFTQAFFFSCRSLNPPKHLSTNSLSILISFSVLSSPPLSGPWHYSQWRKNSAFPLKLISGLSTSFLGATNESHHWKASIRELKQTRCIHHPWLPGMETHYSSFFSPPFSRLSPVAPGTQFFIFCDSSISFCTFGKFLLEFHKFHYSFFSGDRLYPHSCILTIMSYKQSAWVQFQVYSNSDSKQNIFVAVTTINTFCPLPFSLSPSTYLVFLKRMKATKCFPTLRFLREWK